MTVTMIDLPDDLVRQIDALARWKRTTRSELVRDLAEREIAASDDLRRRRIRELLAPPAKGYGGRGTEYIREARDSR
ncbi:ribbon-helix-helix protein, CopG family [Conexibacter stalactiti]|uniref:Ribbon-helix-helix protein, CopG family n=1 Tax=Conexibacter stalactiti TaxID=1940611 RepID=A0ABU4HJK3_9ACTN|nr:ribbon-helix-helix protein, CopG family [Conexibacter stalactiti]MDW5592852.1 ribbon-helix-helix protein, CopG family [Conexibacter stalactiti]MEC5033493.1 ribbon-helix-helix protein, CopG family [Conexibacter stalactiti]